MLIPAEYIDFYEKHAVVQLAVWWPTTRTHRGLTRNKGYRGTPLYVEIHCTWLSIIQKCIRAENKFFKKYLYSAPLDCTPWDGRITCFPPPGSNVSFDASLFRNGRLRLKCDGTRAETRFRLSAKRTRQFKSAGGGGASGPSPTGSRGVRIRGSNAGYTMFRASVKSTGYPLHSPVSPSLPLPCVTVYHHISTGLYAAPVVSCLTTFLDKTPVPLKTDPICCP
jgi:hypothetical protein